MPTCSDCGKYVKPEAAAEHKVKHLQEKLSAIYYERTDKMHRFDAVKSICIYCGHSKAYVANYHPVCQTKKKVAKKKVARKTVKKKVKPVVHAELDHFEFDREA